MGTRSTIHVYEGRKHIISIYNQYDGYLSGIGGDLYEFLSKGQVINGYTLRGDENNFNGVTCLAAQMVANFKKGIGNCYITDKKDRQEFDYFIEVKKDNTIKIKVFNHGDSIFTGNIGEFLQKCIEDGYKPKTKLDLYLTKGA